MNHCSGENAGVRHGANEIWTNLQGIIDDNTERALRNSTTKILVPLTATKLEQGTGTITRLFGLLCIWTCNHVLSTKTKAVQATCVLKYDNLPDVGEYKFTLDPSLFWRTCPFNELDYTIVAIENGHAKKLEEIGVRPIPFVAEVDTENAYGDVFVQSYAEGQFTQQYGNAQAIDTDQQEELIRKGVLKKGYAKFYFLHTANTLRGSSGSTVCPIKKGVPLGIHKGGDWIPNFNVALKLSAVVNHVFCELEESDGEPEFIHSSLFTLRYFCHLIDDVVRPQNYKVVQKYVDSELLKDLFQDILSAVLTISKRTDTSVYFLQDKPVESTAKAKGHSVIGYIKTYSPHNEVEIVVKAMRILKMVEGMISLQEKEKEVIFRAKALEKEGLSAMGAAHYATFLVLFWAFHLTDGVRGNSSESLGKHTFENIKEFLKEQNTTNKEEEKLPEQIINYLEHEFSMECTLNLCKTWKKILFGVV